MTIGLWLENLLFYSLQVLLVVLAGGALALGVRLRSPRLELGYLQALLGFCLILPFAQSWQTPDREVLAEGAMPVDALTLSQAATDSASTGTFSVGPGVGWLLAAGVMVRLSWLGLGFVRLTRYRGESQVLPATPSFVPALEQRFGTKAELRVSSEVRGPVTFGWRRPVVLLPERFLELEPDLQQGILCHELLHVQRRDWVFTVAEESVRAVLWFHPAIWWLISRIHLVREQLVDREAIRLTQSRDPYLQALLAMAGHQLQPDLAPASLFLRKRHLDQRMAAVIRKEFPMSRIRSIVCVTVMASVVAAAVWVATSAFPLQASPQEELIWPDGPQGARVILRGQDYQVHALMGVVEQGGEQLLNEPPVVYSPEAVASGVEGRVVLELSVDENGRVYDALVISGPNELRRPALMSVLSWQYSKEMPLPAKLAVTIRFELPPAETVQPQRAQTASGEAPKRIRVGSAVQRARLVRNVRPQYPALARQARVEGTVQLKVSISSLGRVDLIEVVQGHALLVPAAIEAVKQWEYKPTLLNGAPVEVETTVDVRFLLPDGVSSGASSRSGTPPPAPEP